MKILVTLFCATTAAGRSFAGPPINGLGVASVAPEVLAKFCAAARWRRRSRATFSRCWTWRAPGGATLTPDGKTLFFVWGVTGTAQIWKLERTAPAFPCR